MNSKYKRLLENTGLMFIGSFGSKIISFVMLPFYTMWLSVEDYGASDIISVYSTILLAFISLNIGDAIFVVPSQKSIEEKKSYFTSGLLFSICASIALMLFYIGIRIVLNLTGNSFFDNILYICLITFTSLFITLFQQFCKSIDKIKVYATAGIVQTICVAAFGFLLIPKFKLQGFIYCLIIANIVSALYVFFSATLINYINFNLISKGKLIEMFKYSVPLIPNSIMWLIVSYLNRPLMEKYLGLYAIGIYALANRFPSLINTVYNNFSNSWQISVLEQYKKEGFDRFYNRVTLLMICGLSSFVVVFSILQEPLFKVLLNERYLEATKYIPILCYSCLFISLGSIYGAVFSAERVSKYYFYSSVWSAITAIVCNYVFIKQWGIDGACWSCVASYAIGAISRFAYARKYVSFESSKEIFLFILISLLIICLKSYCNSILYLLLPFLILICYTCYIFKKLSLYPLFKKDELF